MREGKYEPSEHGGTVGTAITFLLIGLGAGALIGMMFAPKAGKQMRKELRRRYQDARGNIEDWSEDARNTVDEVMEYGSDLADEVRNRVSPLVKNLKRR
jgi:gas vesicle protein